MNKRTRKVFQILKTRAKQLGFSRSELKGIAAKIADNLELAEDASEEDEDSAIDEAVDDTMEFLNYSQSAAQRAISNFKKKHNVSEDDEERDEDGDKDASVEITSTSTPPGGNKANKSDDGESGDKGEATPAWAKSLITALQSVGDRVSNLERGNVSKSRRSRLEEMLRDTGKFGVRRMKEFDRIQNTFKSEEEFDEYLDELSADIDDYNQERADFGLGKLGTPGVSNHDKKGSDAVGSDDFKPLDEKDVEALANEF